MNKPFEFDIGEKVMISLPASNRMWGPFTIIDRWAGRTYPVPDGPVRHVENKYEVQGERVAGRIVFAGWYLERNLRRTVLHQLMRARRSSCG